MVWRKILWEKGIRMKRESSMYYFMHITFLRSHTLQTRESSFLRIQAWLPKAATVTLTKVSFALGIV